MRCLATAVALGLLGGALGACSSSGPAKTGGTTTVSPKADRVTAKAINLVATDLPGWTKRANNSSGSNDPEGAKLAACAGATDPQKTEDADVTSPDFDQGQTEISSEADLVRTNTEARRDLAAFTGSKFIPCLQQQGTSALQSQLPSGSKITKFQIANFALPSMPKDSFGIRIVLTVDVPQSGAVDVTTDEIGFLVGRAEVDVTALQGGGNPSAPLEQRLVSLLVTRAHQQGSRTA